MVSWFTIGTARTDGQGFWGLPYALAIMLTTSFTKGFCTFTDRVFISPSVPTDNIYYRWKIGLPSVPTVPKDKVKGDIGTGTMDKTLKRQVVMVDKDFDKNKL